MNKTCRLIKDYQESYPQFSYYKRLFIKAKKNIHPHPDICIETCKSLLEGISKSVVRNKGDDRQRAELKKEDLSSTKLLKTALAVINKNEDIVNDDFINRCGSLAHALSLLRNERGDISHGKFVPKEYESDSALAELSLQMTDAIAYYLLFHYFQMLDSEAEPLVTVLPLIYEEQEEFNIWLDDNAPELEGVRFSKALYDQDYLAYEARQEDFIAQTLPDENGGNE